MPRPAIEAFLSSYIETALWSSNDESTPEGGYPFDDNYGPDDLAPETVDRMRADCEAFLTANEETIATIDQVRDSDPSDVLSAVAHDFWLTRNGHGCGFWDGDYEEPAASILTKASEAFGGCDLYVGDDGLIYLA